MHGAVHSKSFTRKAIECNYGASCHSIVRDGRTERAEEILLARLFFHNINLPNSNDIIGIGRLDKAWVMEWEMGAHARPNQCYHLYLYYGSAYSL